MCSRNARLSNSFFLPRSSGLHALHPLTKLVLASGLVVVALAARSGFVPIALFLFLIVPLAAWGKIAHSLVRTSVTIVLPFALSIGLIQGLFFPGATTVLVQVGPLAFKEEGLKFAFLTVPKILVLAGAGLLLLYSTDPADLMAALEQRGMPAGMAYSMVAAIQLFPQMQARAESITAAQRARGLETEGSLWLRLRGVPPLIGPLISSALVDVTERAMALDARAFSSPRKKTNYKELRDTRGQSAARWLMLVVALIVAVLEVYGP